MPTGRYGTMANSNFVVHNGLTVGPLTIFAGNGDISTAGNITSPGLSSSSITKNDTSISINDTGSGSSVVIAIDGVTEQTIDANGLKVISNIVAGSTTNSISSTTGALVVIGGLGVGGNVTFDGNTSTSGKLIITESTNATPYVMGSGAFHVAGGMSIGKDFWVGGNLYVANVISQSTTILEVNEPLVYLDATDYPYNYDIGVFSDFVGGSANVYQYTGAVRSYQTNEWVFFSNLKTAPGGGIVSITSADILYDPVKVGNLVVANTTVSTSNTTGALIVKGGAGIGGALYITNTGDVSANIGAYQTYANTKIGTNTNSNLVVVATTTSTSTTTGALVVRGGVGIAGNVFVGGTGASSLRAGAFVTDALNLDPGAATFGNIAAVFGKGTTQSGTGIIGWNRSAGGGEMSFVQNKNGGTPGGFIFYDWPNTSINTTNPVFNISSTGNVIVYGNITPNANLTYDIGSSTAWYNTFYGISTQAKYADLAENYQADAPYEPGTVLEFGGEYELTLAEDGSKRVAGVVSTNPAHLMNGMLRGPNVVPLALQGRTPCRVRGKISKGDMLISGGSGYARPDNNPIIGTVIGKALEDFNGIEGVIEVVIGRL